MVVALSQTIERQALDEAPVMVRDLQGRITLWTGGMERVYGYPSATCLGQVAHEMLDTQFPAPRAEIEAEVRGQGAWKGRLLERGSDGNVIAVASRWSLLRDGDDASILICNSDITVEWKTLENHRLLASIVESSQDAVIGKDLWGLITSWNRAAEKMFGYAPEEIIGQPVTALFPKDLIAEEGMILERLRRGDRIENYETIRRHKDGRPVHVNLTVSPILDPNGGVIGASKSARDIGERIALGKRLDELQAELVHISRVNDMGEMASVLAHELAQPLSAISAYVDGARRCLDRGDTALAMEGCKRANGEVVRATEILNRIGNFVRKGPMRFRREALNPIIDDAMTMASLNPIAKGLRIDVQIAADADVALVDKIQLQQVVLNLIRNAAEAMKGQERRLIAISTRRLDPEMIAVEVADNGPGLALDVLAHLFEPFRTTKPEGMGIGLSLCRTIVRAHGGEICVADVSHAGAVFVLTLMSPAS